MGTTLTALYFDGSRLAMAHVGDSRAYLYRSGVLHQLTHDDTFVQSLVDDGRITEEEAIHHPQRNLLLRALNGTELEPGLTQREARAGDRYLICSDGLCGVVSAEAIADALTEPDPERAADVLVELALVAGGPDNVTVVVADVIDTGSPATERIAPVVIDPDATGPIGQMTREMPRVPLPPIPEEPGAPTRYAADGEQDDLDDDLDDRRSRTTRTTPTSRTKRLRARTARRRLTATAEPVKRAAARRAGLWRGRRGEPSDPNDPAVKRRRWRRRGAVTLALAALLLVVVGGSALWVNSQYFVGARGDMVGVYRGVNGSLLGVQFSTFQEDSCAGAPACTPIRLADLEPAARVQVQAGIQANSLADARAVMGRLAGRLLPPCTTAAVGERNRRRERRRRRKHHRRRPARDRDDLRPADPGDLRPADALGAVLFVHGDELGRRVGRPVRRPGDVARLHQEPARARGDRDRRRHDHAHPVDPGGHRHGSAGADDRHRDHGHHSASRRAVQLARLGERSPRRHRPRRSRTRPRSPPGRLAPDWQLRRRPAARRRRRRAAPRPPVTPRPLPRAARRPHRIRRRPPHLSRRSPRR